MTGQPGIDLTAAFPQSLAEDVRLVQARLVSFHEPLGEFTVKLSSGPVSIPYRLYLKESPETELSPTQQSILHCIYTRNHDGYVREAHLEALLARQHEEWICPYVWALLGEQVIELIYLIKAHAHRLDLRLYSEFLARNPEYQDLTRQRARSYWNCYYRYHRIRIKTVEQYPSYEIFSLFESETKESIE